MLAWFWIVVGIGGGIAEFPSPSTPRFAVHLWMHVLGVAMCIGLGWFILWSKRREPRPHEADVKSGASLCGPKLSSPRHRDRAAMQQSL